MANTNDPKSDGKDLTDKELDDVSGGSLNFSETLEIGVHGPGPGPGGTGEIRALSAPRGGGGPGPAGD